MKKARAKLFRHGGSQAVRLPREFRLPGKEAAVSPTSTGGVLLEPLNADFETKRKRFMALAGSCPGLTDVPPHFPHLALDAKTAPITQRSAMILKRVAKV